MVFIFARQERYYLKSSSFSHQEVSDTKQSEIQLICLSGPQSRTGSSQKVSGRIIKRPWHGKLELFLIYHGVTMESRRSSNAKVNEIVNRFILTMTGCNITNITSKQLEKMSNNQLIDFAMKVQENSISKQNALSSKNKQINAQLQNIDMKINQLNKKNNLSRSRLSVAKSTSTFFQRITINIQKK